MYSNPYAAHLDERILSTDPLELVCIIYAELRSSISAARQCIRETDRAGRSRHLTRAFNLMAELGNSLDRESGGEIAGRLAQLYRYVVERLNQANIEQIEQPLIDADRTLATLEEGWKAIRAQRDEQFASVYSPLNSTDLPLALSVNG